MYIPLLVEGVEVVAFSITFVYHRETSLELHFPTFFLEISHLTDDVLDFCSVRATFSDCCCDLCTVPCTLMNAAIPSLLHQFLLPTYRAEQC